MPLLEQWYIFTGNFLAISTVESQLPLSTSRTSNVSSKISFEKIDESVLETVAALFSAGITTESNCDWSPRCQAQRYLRAENKCV